MSLPFEHHKNKHDSGIIDLVLDKPYYLGGEMVNGSVNIDLITPVNANSLNLKLKGFERTMVESVSSMKMSDGSQNPQLDKCKEENIFFNQTVIIYKIGGTLPPGKHSYPFSYQLPSNLPGVFYEERKGTDGSAKGAVVYKIKVYLDPIDKGSTLKFEQGLVLSETVVNQIVPIKDHQEKGFLFALGKIKMNVEIGKNVFVPGETVAIKLHVDNDSSKVVNSCKVKLMRHIIIKAKSDVQHHHSSFYKSYTEEVCRQQYEGCPPKTKHDVELAFTIPSKNIYPTTIGQLIKNTFQLVIECDIPMAFDLESKPDIIIALLPAKGQVINLYTNYKPKSW